MGRPLRAVALVLSAACVFAACATGVKATEEPEASNVLTGGTGGSGGAGGALSAASSSSSGMPAMCSNKADCAAFEDACHVGNCVNGMCEKAAANDGAACDDGLYCTDNDACQSGSCVGGTQKFCPSPDSCHVGACDEATKACGSAPGNDGASCDDGDPCTYSGTCSNGSCSKGPAVDCSAFNGTCSNGVCDPVLGCVAKPKNDGAPCDDSLFCTVNDVCMAGACQGVPNTCSNPVDAACMVGSCNEAQKSCVAVPGNDGNPCDDGNPCTVSEMCGAGKCTGGVPGNEGLTCDDKDGCTGGTKCTSGVCGNPQSQIVQCVAGDMCCPAGCNSDSDTDCVPPLLALAAYDAKVTFPDAGVAGTRMTITWDGTNYWESGGGFPGQQLAQISAAGQTLNLYQGPDFRSVFTVDGVGAVVYVRQYGNNTIQTMPNPGNYVNGTTLVGGNLDSQSAVVFNPGGTEYVGLSSGTIDRWDINGSHLQSFSLSGFGQNNPNENQYPQNRGVIAVGPYYITYVDQTLSAWDSNGVRVKTAKLNNAGISSDSYFSLSYANHMVFIVDSAGGMWRGYDIGG